MICIGNQLGVPAGVEGVGQGGSNRTAVEIQLVVEEGNAVALAGTPSQHFPGGLGNFQLPASPSLIVSDDLVEGLEGYR